MMKNLLKGIIAVTTTLFLAIPNGNEAINVVTNAEIYPALAIVTETNLETDCVTIETLPDRNVWTFTGVEDWMCGDLMACTFSDNGTEELKDDILSDNNRCVGYLNGETIETETGEKLLWYEFCDEFVCCDGYLD